MLIPGPQPFIFRLLPAAAFCILLISFLIIGTTDPPDVRAGADMGTWLLSDSLHDAEGPGVDMGLQRVGEMSQPRVAMPGGDTLKGVEGEEAKPDKRAALSGFDGKW